MADGGTQRASFRDVFAVPQFRALWLAQLLSVAGDQLARVALTLLVYQRTHSAVLAAVTFVMGMLPVFVGGALLSGLGDRLPRRAVMIGCDLARAALVAIMVIPGVPLAVLVVLLFAVTSGNAPFTSARAAIYPDILAGDRYLVGTAVTLTTAQFAQVIGFAAGGAITGFFGVRACLLVDVASFLASALLIRLGVAVAAAVSLDRTGEKDGTGRPRRAAPLADIITGARLVFSRPALRTPMLLAWLAAFYNAPEGVATAFAHQLHGGGAAAGLLLAAPAAGYTVGALIFGRLISPAARGRLMTPLATACSALLVLVALRPGLPGVLVILAASGGCACFQVAAQAAFVAAAPASRRSQAFGLATAGLTLGQGAAMIVAGAAAQHFTATSVVAVAGLVGTVAAVALSVRRRPRPAG
ncbi:MAG TPA: MFS transporter [Streptosporangiaceae bacterium]|jgi:MFS family permease